MDLRDGDAVEPGATDGLNVRTVVDVSGSVATPVETDGRTANESSTATKTTTAPSGESGTLSVTTIHEDAAGDESDNLNYEYVVFENTGDEPLDLSGWTVSDEADHTYTFPSGFTLDPGADVTLHTGSGSNDATDLYWGSDTPIWNNGGDTVIVKDDDGEIVLEEEY